MFVFSSNILKKTFFMSILHRVKILGLLALNLFALTNCKSDQAAEPLTLSLDNKVAVFENTGGTSTVTASSNAPTITATSDATWLTVTQTTGKSGTIALTLTSSENTTTTLRSAIVTVTASTAPSVQIKVSQKPSLYPNYNTAPIAADAVGMGSTATELANKIKVGWNIGNTLEAIGGETNWGNPKVSNDLIALVKKSGFNAVRIPCSWDQYADQTTAEIKASWLSRVKEVTQTCVNNDMYVIINIHWDGGWLENNCTVAKQVENNAKQKAFWQQIATTLRDFDEHVLFASANEPNVDDATKMGVLLSYHQTFIDAVRATGGKNAYRTLVVQGPSTDIETTNKLMTKMPTDKVPNRMMAEIHYYTPWNFTGMTKDESWGNQFYYWGKNYHSTTDLVHNPTWGEESTVDSFFSLMKKQFVDNGIPVIIGEFGAMRRDNLTGDALKLHLDSRAYFLYYVTKQAKANGMIPFYWDNGGLNNLSSGIFDRKANTVYDAKALNALVGF